MGLHIQKINSDYIKKGHDVLTKMELKGAKGMYIGDTFLSDGRRFLSLGNSETEVRDRYNNMESEAKNSINIKKSIKMSTRKKKTEKTAKLTTKTFDIETLNKLTTEVLEKRMKATKNEDERKVINIILGEREQEAVSDEDIAKLTKKAEKVTKVDEKDAKKSEKTPKIDKRKVKKEKVSKVEEKPIKKEIETPDAKVKSLENKKPENAELQEIKAEWETKKGKRIKFKAQRNPDMIKGTITGVRVLAHIGAVNIVIAGDDGVKYQKQVNSVKTQIIFLKKKTKEQVIHL